MPVQIWLPIDVCELAIQCNLVKPLQVYLYLKLFTSGKCHRSSDVFVQLKRDLSIKSNRTLKKYFEALLLHNWMGYNSISGYYFIRSAGKLPIIGKRSRIAYRVELKDIQNIQALLTGILLCDNVRRQKIYWENKKKKNQAAANKKVTANQLGYSSDSPSYYGLSNKSLANMLGCRQTRACVLKQAAEKAGYIKVHHKYRKILTLKKQDHSIREHLYQQFPGITGRLHFKGAKENGECVVHLLQQTYDEIIPEIKFGKWKR